MIPSTIGRYQIKKELARGGMATVYVAYDPRFERDVAIKVLPAYFAHEKDFFDRFEREAKTIAGLEHPAIVPVYDYGEEGSPYLVMRLMRAGSLKEKLEDGPLPIKSIIQTLERVADALDVAHQKGLVHRDLKPGNILFDEDEKAYLSDFGVVKVSESSVALTRTGGIIGTPAYMSPEQGMGTTIDGRSDIYSLGVMAYEMLTGDAPFRADTPVGMMMKHVTEPVPSFPRTSNLPQDYEAIVQRAMAKKPADRYSKATVFVADLRVAVQNQLSSTAPAHKPVEDNDATIILAPATSYSLSEATGEVTRQAALKTPQKDLSAEVATERTRNLIPWLVGVGILAVITIIAFVLIFRNQQQTQQQAVNDAEATRIAEVNIQETAAAQAMIVFAQETAEFESMRVTETAVANSQIAAQAATVVAIDATASAQPTPTFTPEPTPFGGGGNLVAFESDRDGNREVYTMNVDGTGITRLSNEDMADGDPAWSPDGKKLAINSERDGDSEVYILDADGSNLLQLTDNSVIDWGSVWSPDGNKIAFASSRDGKLDIFVMNADGSEPVQLTKNDINDTFPAWSPDGQWILFESVLSNEARQLNMIRVDGTELTPLTDGNVIDQHVAMSPDGNKIAFTSNRDGEKDVYIMNTDGSQVMRLTTSEGVDGWPIWSSDGTKIIFESNRDGNSEIYIMNADGTEQINLTNNLASDRFPDWQPTLTD